MKKLVTAMVVAASLASTTAMATASFSADNHGYMHKEAILHALTQHKGTLGFNSQTSTERFVKELKKNGFKVQQNGDTMVASINADRDKVIVTCKTNIGRCTIGGV